MRTFEHFPANRVCPLCGSSDDGPCFLMAIAGTQNDGICEATPVHAACWDGHCQDFMYYPKDGVIAARVAKAHIED